MSVDPKLAIRFKRAWNALSARQQSRLEPHIQLAHDKLDAYLESRKAPDPGPVIHRGLLLAQSVLMNDQQTLAMTGTLATNQILDIEGEVYVDPGGDIWGFGKYQLLDPGWFGSSVVCLENLAFGDRFPFGSVIPDPVSIPNAVRIVLAGDFGTGDYGGAVPAPSTKIRKFIPSLRPHITVHLGDVYYAGTEGSEQANLVSLWPSGSLGSCTLNSNHEMYSGANPYFRQALASDLFSIQRKRSFFVLENDYWTIIGLDSAYYSDPLDLYANGTLDQGIQIPFLQKFGNRGKNLLILTHHNGLSQDGRETTELWSQVTNALHGRALPTYWYWGHVHSGAVYTADAGRGFMCRCIGHGGLPSGNASILEGNPNVQWHEPRRADDPYDPVRVLDGFALLSLDGKSISEVFYDENGAVAWQL